MFFKKKVYPILPTSESDTMTFIQKLDYLEYKLTQLNEKVVAAESAISDLETAVEGKSTVSATAEGSTLQTLTVDGTTYDVPQGTEVSATDDDGVLQTLTIGDDTYTVPQGGDAGIKGGGKIGGNSNIQWRLVDDIFCLEIVNAAGTDAFENNIIAIRLEDVDTHNYGGLDGTTIKTVISWLHSENGVTWPVWAEVQLNVIEDGLGTLTLTKGAFVLTGNNPIAGSDVLADLKGLPLTFMNVPTL